MSRGQPYYPRTLLVQGIATAPSRLGWFASLTPTCSESARGGHVIITATGDQMARTQISVDEELYEQANGRSRCLDMQGPAGRLREAPWYDSLVFDTHAIARALTDAKLTPEQADAITDAVRQAANDSGHVTLNMLRAAGVSGSTRRIAT